MFCTPLLQYHQNPTLLPGQGSFDRAKSSAGPRISPLTPDKQHCNRRKQSDDAASQGCDDPRRDNRPAALVAKVQRPPEWR
jgi:hypothetical protein